MCLLAICISSLEKRLFKTFHSFFDWVVYFFDVEMHELFVYFVDFLVSCFICKCVLTFCELSFHFVYVCLGCVS